MTDNEREEQEDETKAQLRESRQIWLAPDCCKTMRRHKPIIAHATSNEKPIWYLRLALSSYDNEIVAAERTHGLELPAPTACPFCTASLPEIVKRTDPLSPLAVYCEGYCKTCGERVGTCSCWPPWMAWEVKK